MDILKEFDKLYDVRIRIDEATQQISLIDIVRAVTGFIASDASTYLRRIPSDLQEKFSPIRINNKGRLTPCADVDTCLTIVSMLPGKHAHALQATKFREAFTLKRKLSELIESGETTVESKEHTLRLFLSKAQVQKDNKVIRSYDYLKGVLPSAKEAMSLVEAIFPTEFAEEVPEPETGFVYFIRVQNTNMVKIGYTTKPVSTRMSQLQVGNHQTLELLGVIETNTYKQLEQDVHAALHNFRIRGEWFHLEDATGFIEQC